MHVYKMETSTAPQEYYIPHRCMLLALKTWCYLSAFLGVVSGLALMLCGCQCYAPPPCRGSVWIWNVSNSHPFFTPPTSSPQSFSPYNKMTLEVAFYVVSFAFCTGCFKILCTWILFEWCIKNEILKMVIHVLCIYKKNTQNYKIYIQHTLNTNTHLE